MKQGYEITLATIDKTTKIATQKEQQKREQHQGQQQPMTTTANDSNKNNIQQ